MKPCTRGFDLIELNYQNPLMGVLVIFSTGTRKGMGTMCVESEICYEKYHEKNVLFMSLKLKVETKRKF